MKENDVDRTCSINVGDEKHIVLQNFDQKISRLETTGMPRSTWKGNVNMDIRQEKYMNG
jgi:hypothetical protein